MRRILLLSFLAVTVLLTGCAGISQLGQETGEVTLRAFHESPDESDSLNFNYRLTWLGITNSATILDQIKMRENEVISQSQSVIGCYGEEKNRQKAWFNVVAFDEEKLTASRKYFLSSYDRPKEWFILKEKLRFDAELMMPAAVMDEPYTSSNIKRIEILDEVRKTYNADMVQLEPDNRKMANIGMLVNQTINTVIVSLKESPAFAEMLEMFEGYDFDHPTLGEGKIRIVIDHQRNVVKIKIKIGTVVRDWSEQPDVIDMDSDQDYDR